MLRDLIVDGLAGKDLSGIEFTVCEEYTNPPAHLRRPGHRRSGFTFTSPTARSRWSTMSLKALRRNSMRLRLGEKVRHAVP